MLVKSDLSAGVKVAIGCTKAESDAAVDAVFDVIREGLAKGEEVRLPQFGTFRAPVREAHTARNPMTGESVSVPAKRMPGFKPSAPLKKAVA